MARDDILVLARTKKNVLLRTLDVRQIQRKVLGKRKPPGMESNKVEYTRFAER